MNFIKKLENDKSVWFLIGASVIFFILRWPSLFEPYWYGDEGIYQAIGILIKNGAPLYSGAWDNKPPLLYIIYALFSSDQFLMRSLSLIFGIISVWIFYFLGRRLFENNKAAVTSTIIFVFYFGTRLLEGNIANAENLILLPILLSAYLFLSANKIKRIKPYITYIIAGIILGLAFLTKTVAIFDLLAFTSFVIIASSKDIKKNLKTQIIPFTIGYIFPILITSFYFLITKNLMPFINASFFSNVSYVGYENSFFIPQGLLYLKIILLISFILFLFIKRNNFSRNTLFVLIWFSFSLFNAFFSGRTYSHYLLVLLPSFCLMIGLIIAEKKYRFFSLLYLTFAFIIIYSNFTFHGKLPAYYLNLFEFCSNKKNISAYQSFFDGNTPRDYELARYIRANTTDNESILLWGNNAQIYKLAEKNPILRYTVAYHINQFPDRVLEMKQAIETKKPKLILIMPNVPSIPISLIGYQEKINMKGVLIYEKVL